ncbi:MAG: HAD family hydrolase [Rhizobiaceae bacterium]
MSRYFASASEDLPHLNPLLKGVELVIFDFDGVIADSEEISLSTLQETFREFGIEVTHDDTRNMFLGKSLKTIATHVRAHGAGKVEEFAKKWETALFGRFRNELEPMSGVTGILDYLDSVGIAYCIASSSTFKRIDVALGSMGLTDRFPRIFSAQQVVHGKPQPDLFLLAASMLSTEPEACLAIEDSPFGVHAAKSAGMRCAGFVGGCHLEGIQTNHGELLLQSGADFILSSYEPLSSPSGLAE